MLFRSQLRALPSSTGGRKAGRGPKRVPCDAELDESSLQLQSTPLPAAPNTPQQSPQQQGPLPSDLGHTLQKYRYVMVRPPGSHYHSVPLPRALISPTHVYMGFSVGVGQQPLMAVRTAAAVSREREERAVHMPQTAASHDSFPLPPRFSPLPE